VYRLLDMDTSSGPSLLPESLSTKPGEVQHLCRIIKQMENEGIILRKKGWLILHEPKRLSCPETSCDIF
jgi:hypothetical protein